MNQQWKVPYVDLVRQHEPNKEPLREALDRLLRSGQFILGEEVEKFENQFAAYIGVKHTIGVGNGTDALFLALKALNIGPGDEVITTPNSYLASASSIALTGAKPVFVDVAEDFNINPDLIEDAVTEKTRAIMPVHLTGRPARMREITQIANEHNLYVIEDAAQAVGAEYHSQKVGSFGIYGCFSLHPLKNLNALGDGGIITTDDDTNADWLRRARNHGHPNRDECDFWSHNMRLDALQAAFLRLKLQSLDAVTERRRENARMYHEALHEFLQVPQEAEHEKCVYHTYVVQTEWRDDLKAYLAQQGIDTKIHYPTPIPFLKSAQSLGYTRGSFPVTEKQAKEILSLPIYPELTQNQLEFIVKTIRRFLNENRHSF